MKSGKKKAVWTVQKKEHRQDLARMLRATLIQIHHNHCQWGWNFGHQKDRVIPFVIGRPGCESIDNIDFAHIHGKETEVNGSGRGQYYRLKDIFDYPDSYILLCKEHHLEYDSSNRPVKLESVKGGR